jgi:glycosyltransferase involved in cell wall biosynthesis
MLVTRDHVHEISSPASPVSLDAWLARSLDPAVRVERLHHRRSDPRSLLEVLRLRRRIAAWGADVVHVQETTDWRLVLLALSLRRPIVVTVHDVEVHPGERRGLQATLLRQLVRRARAVVVHGEALRQQFLRVFPGRPARQEVASIPHGVLSTYRAGDDPSVEEDPCTVLFFGRIAPYKGIEDLLAAQPRIAAAVPGARVVIAGGGPFEPYRPLVPAGGGVEIHNRFIPDEEVPRLFRRAAVVVLPYREASQTGVVPIACDFGKPAVVTRVGGLPEAVDDGVSGLVVEPGDPVALADAIVRVLRDEGLRRRLGEGARRVGETRLSWRAIAAETSRLYGRIA